MTKVKNRSDSTVGYYLPEERITRNFAPGEVKDLKKEELEKVAYIPGGLTILQDYLLIADKELAESLGIKTEPEYWMTEDEIKENITHGSLDLFLDILDFAPQGVIDIIKKLAVELPLGDTYKLEALYKATGFDANAAIRNMRESNEGLVNKEEVVKPRRVPVEEAPKTSVESQPVKYKIIEK